MRLNNVVLFKKEKQKIHTNHFRLNNVVLFKKRTTKNYSIHLRLM